MIKEELLYNLVNFEGDLKLITQQLTEFGLDSEEPLVTIELAHLANVLNKYLDGQDSEEEVEEWANSLEGREDINYATNSAETISELIHELANPLLTQPLTSKRAEEIIKEAINESIS